MMKKIVSFGLILLVVSCGKSVMNAEIGIPFKMTGDQTVKIVQTDLSFNGFKVTEDSRCPKGANCIWEGQVVAEFDLNGSTFKMNTQKMTDTLGYRFQIKSVLPEKEQDVEITLPSYILEILVIKNTKRPVMLETM